jgi:glycerophosphoryl diester phosphodiesterase
MNPPLPPGFLARPVAHRALHGEGRAENSLAAVAAAVAAGYGIEIDVQLTSDGRAVVFHDETLDRLTAQRGLVRERHSRELATIPLSPGGGTIPRLREVLEAVAGRVPLVVEVKDQDGRMGPDVGALEQAVAIDLASYDGPVAVMSFNPHSVDAMRHYAPLVPRGLTTCSWRPEDWPGVPADLCARMRGIPDVARTGAAFISHEARDLDRPRVAELKAAGMPVLCWTIRSAEAEAEARKIADCVTFEGYAAALPRLDAGVVGAK